MADTDQNCRDDFDAELRRKLKRISDMRRLADAAGIGHATWKAGYDECKAELRRKLKRIADMDISEGAKAHEFLKVLTKFFAE